MHAAKCQAPVHAPESNDSAQRIAINLEFEAYQSLTRRAPWPHGARKYVIKLIRKADNRQQSKSVPKIRRCYSGRNAYSLVRSFLLPADVRDMLKCRVSGIKAWERYISRLSMKRRQGKKSWLEM